MNDFRDRPASRRGRFFLFVLGDGAGQAFLFGFHAMIQGVFTGALQSELDLNAADKFVFENLTRFPQPHEDAGAPDLLPVREWAYGAHEGPEDDLDLFQFFLVLAEFPGIFEAFESADEQG